MLPDQLKLTNYKNRINNNKVGMQLVLVHKTLLTLYQFNGLTSSMNLIFAFVICIILYTEFHFIITTNCLAVINRKQRNQL